MSTLTPSGGASPLYVGIDVSLQTNACRGLDGQGQPAAPALSVKNNLSGVQAIEEQLRAALTASRGDAILLATEATSFSDLPVLDYLATSPHLTGRLTAYRFNPQQGHAFRKVFGQLHKTDPSDAALLATRLRFGELPRPFQPAEAWLPLQRLTRFRAQTARMVTQEKTRFLTHLFLKVSASQQERPFSTPFGATSQALIQEFGSTDEILATPLEELIRFVCQHGHNRFPHPEEVVRKLQTGARESYRIRPALAKSVTLVLALSYRNIRALTQTIQELDRAIAQELAGFPQTLTSLPGIGPVYAAGIFAEIGNITRFAEEAHLARFAGLCWQQHQSGGFRAEDTPLMKRANSYLRYYLSEAANLVRQPAPEFRAYYQAKYAQTLKHQHKRALVLPARKLVRVISVLLAKGQLYQPAQGRCTLSAQGR